jgi:hypothetical protein
MPPSNREEPAIVVTKAYDLVLWLLPKAETFSRSYRFSLGERVVAHGLDLLLALVEASYTANKASLLQQANGKVNGLRYLLRLAKDLRLLTVDSYAFAGSGPHRGGQAAVRLPVHARGGFDRLGSGCQYARIPELALGY